MMYSGQVTLPLYFIFPLVVLPLFIIVLLIWSVGSSVQCLVMCRCCTQTDLCWSSQMLLRCSNKKW